MSLVGTTIVEHYETTEDEIEALVKLNHQRERTNTQKAREAAALLEVERVKAEKRKAAHQFGNENQPLFAVVANSPPPKERGKSRDAVAEKVGLKSGHDAARAINTVKKIDQLNAKGDGESKKKADTLQGVLNNRTFCPSSESERIGSRVPGGCCPRSAGAIYPGRSVCSSVSSHSPFSVSVTTQDDGLTGLSPFPKKSVQSGE